MWGCRGRAGPGPGKPGLAHGLQLDPVKHGERIGTAAVKNFMRPCLTLRRVGCAAEVMVTGGGGGDGGVPFTGLADGLDLPAGHLT